MATTSSVAAALEQRVELQVTPAGPFMLLAHAARAQCPSRCSQQTQGTDNSTARGSFDVGFEMGGSPGHALPPN